MIALFFLVNGSLQAQDHLDNLRPIARELMARKKMYPHSSPELFIQERVDEALPDMTDHVRNAEFFHLKSEVLSRVHATRPEFLQLPLPLRDKGILLDLYRVDIFSEAYHLRTNDALSFPRRDDQLFYRGIVAGDLNSIATVSMIGDEVRVLFSSEQGNHRMHRVNDAQYIFYKDSDVIQRQTYHCAVTDEQVMHNISENINQRSMLTGNCVEVYFECDYKSYQDNGNSVLNTEAWVAALFNEVATIYDNEEIPVFISDIMVWTTSDPYADLDTISHILNEFVDQIDQNGYDGRLAHLLSTRNLGGGIAYIDVLCSNFVPCAVSTSLSTTIVEFPNYSWNIEVITHEMGHNFGSPHTHNCVWNGNNTQIDDCGSEAGDEQQCYDPDNPILPVDGTIMSYCHLVGVGINFSLGFGPQPGDLIRNEYQNATCNTGTCTPPPCTELSSPVHLSTLVDVNSNISWVAVTGADGYRLTIGTSPGSGNIVNNIDVGQITTYDPSSAFPFNSNIYVKVVPYNSLGNATGCMEEYFTTEPNVAPACTALTYPLDGATNIPTSADLFWTHSVGNQQGYKITLGTTPGGGEILNLFNVGNVTTYNPGTLPASTTLYVKITPYWTGGDISGCIEESFTTAEPAYCASQSLSNANGWISEVSLGTFANTSGAGLYTNFTNLTAHVSAGGSFPISITAGYSGQPLNENFRVWIDSNHDGVFQNPGERVFQAGGVSGTASGTINIPVTSYIGVTRMRVSMRYGLYYSTPCLTFNYGEVEDYSIQIHCNLVTSTSDEGPGSLPWCAGCVDSGETITFKSTLHGQTISLEAAHVIIDSPLSITANPADDITVYGLSEPRVFQINDGVNASISGLYIIAGSAAEGSAIDNFGTLTLTDTQIYPHPGISTSKLIRNTGTLILDGDCAVH